MQNDGVVQKCVYVCARVCMCAYLQLQAHYCVACHGSCRMASTVVAPQTTGSVGSGNSE